MTREEVELRCPCWVLYSVLLSEHLLMDGWIVTTAVPAIFPSNYFSNKHISRKNWTRVCLELIMFS